MACSMMPHRAPIGDHDAAHADAPIERIVAGFVPPLRILFVLEYFPPHVGGVETLFDQLTAALAREGHRVTVITLRLPGTKTREWRNGVEILRVRTPRRARRYLFTVLAFPLTLRKAVRVDIVHTTTYNAAIPAWLAAAIARKPAVLTVHEVFGDQWNNLLGLHPLAGYAFRCFEWSVLRLPFAHYLCDSQFTRGRLLRFMGIAPSRASVVYPAVDYTFWETTRHPPRPVKDERGLHREMFLYLYFGRPGISKGIEYLIDAALHIRERLPQSHLLMLLADDPPDQYRRLIQRIARLGLTDHITVRDPVPRDALPGYLLGADCVVIPSISEGFGYAAIEAATLGCSVVATAGHSVEEVLGESATYVPPRDPVALAEAVVRVAAGQRPSRPPRRFDIAAHSAGVAAIYARMVGVRRRTGRGRCDA
jgi:D-inositol-3-phosphate glycosyltransferase